MDAAVEAKNKLLVGQLLQAELSLQDKKLPGEKEGTVLKAIVTNTKYIIQMLYKS